MAVKGVIGIVLLALLAYGFVEARRIIAGPSIAFDSPSAYTSFPDGFVTVSGTAKNSDTLTMNGGPLPVDTEGKFSELITLPRGGGILSFTAKDRLGRSVTEQRAIYVP